MVDQEPINDPCGFSSEWLTLRETADHAARSWQLTHRLAAWAREQTALHVIELGCGTGSNLRYLCPHLGHGQHWTLYDYDDILLKNLPMRLQEWAGRKKIGMSASNGIVTITHDDFSATVQWRRTDLANALDALPFGATQLITASALLDLTSKAWLQQLAGHCINHQCASLFVLNYDGDISWAPAAGADELTSRLLNEHQLGDKGFGPAMGPLAGRTLASLLRREQQVTVENSDWHIDTRQQKLQMALLDGWIEAAREMAPSESARLAQWYESRRRLIASMESSLNVGHTDILSLPAEVW